MLKRRPVPPPAKKTNTETSSVATVEKKEIKRVAPPARRPVAPPPKAKVEVPKEEPKKELPKTGATPPNRQPRVPRKTSVPVKEVKTVEPKKEAPKQVEPRPSEEAPKPTVSTGSHAPQAEPRPSASREERAISSEAMREMSFEDRYKLYKLLNTNPEVFTPIVRKSDLPRTGVSMRKDEALLRKLISERPPKAPKMGEVHYCPYCVDWQLFVPFTWTGYTKCCGCSMSTRDWYVSADNKLFNKGD